MITYGSVCSGIEAASVAWEPLGFRPSWFSQFDPDHNYNRGPDFPSAVLAHHWPQVPNLGDMTIIAEAVRYGFIDAPDVLVGGTPCQAFSVAGLRGGLSDGRGFLTLKFVELADEIDRQRSQPAIIVWENVPGVLSSKDNAFGCFLAGLAGESEPLIPSGGKWSNAGYVSGPSRTVAWRILDAQYFGVAQRRRRVFVVASARDGFDPAAVLFESDGVRRDTAPSREARQETATDAGSGAKVRSHWDGVSNPHPTLSQSHNTGGIGQINQELFSQRGAGLVHGYRMVAFGEYSGDGTASTMKARDYKDATDLAVAYAFQPRIARNGRGDMGDVVNALTATAGETGKGDAAPCVAYGISGQESITPWEQQGRRIQGITGVAPTLMSNPNGGMKLDPLFDHSTMVVRRLTPTECERLQGFPDGHTLLNGRTADGPRYKALGNSMAVPVMRWIGNRIILHILGAI